MTRPVGLKEAALDSPSFRASVTHFNDQVDQVERWIDGFVKSITKLSLDAGLFDGSVNTFTEGVALPLSLSEAVIDHDFTALALKRHIELLREIWLVFSRSLEKVEFFVAAPLKKLLHGDLRSFKDVRRQLDQSQKLYDNAQTRFSAQTKYKEPSSLREDAFQLHENRKHYLKASMDYICAAPHFKHTLDKALIQAFADQSQHIREAQRASAPLFSKNFFDIERLRSWAQAISDGEISSWPQLHESRQRIENASEKACRPTRELDSYSLTSYLSAKALGSGGLGASGEQQEGGHEERQGWLNIKTTPAKSFKSTWTRKWVYIKSGIFGWLVQGSKSGGVEESDRTGVLLCAVRVATSEDRRFCFEVKTKDSAVVLQANSHQEVRDWIQSFDAAKQTAVVDNTSMPHANKGENNFSPAFAISPPDPPEFAANAVDAGLLAEEHQDRNSNLLAPSLPDQPGSVHRASFDAPPGRRSNTLDSDNAKDRDQHFKKAQRFDISRRSVGVPTIGHSSTSGATATGGIASLISASNMALPLGTGLASQMPTTELLGSHSQAHVLAVQNAIYSSSRSLANLPNPTNLSSLAVSVASEDRWRLSWTSDSKIPSVVLANVWGSSHWGRTAWLGGDGGGELALANLNTKDSGIRVGIDKQKHIMTRAGQGDASSRTPLEESRTVNATSRIVTSSSAGQSVGESLTSAYPVSLQQQNSQFRLLFPKAPIGDRVMLVFHAAWFSTRATPLTGHVFVTTRSMMLFGNRFGLVTTEGLHLDQVAGVSSSPGQRFDILSLQIRSSDGAGAQKITMHIFLEQIRPLTEKLQVLVTNAQSENPMGPLSMFKEFLKIEKGEADKEASSATGSVEAHSGVRCSEQAYFPQDSGDLHAHSSAMGHGLGVYGSKGGKFNTKFTLPKNPVVYIPQGWTEPVVESDFQISPKALFHIMFGDYSAVWQTLYRSRGAQSVKQGPWSREKESHLTRAFDYTIRRRKALRSAQLFVVRDTQIIDVLSDHLCYVVTYRKAASHLPCLRQFDLMTKIVITYIAKSRCRLAMYAKVEWSKTPPLAGALVEREALQDVKSDVSDIADLVAEQIRRLGLGANTKRAVDVFGSVGQQKHSMTFSDDQALEPRNLRFRMAHKTVVTLVANAILSVAKLALNLAIVSFVAFVNWIIKSISAHWSLIALLMASSALNTVLLSRPLRFWWTERHAVGLLDKLGVGRDLRMHRTIALEVMESGYLPPGSRAQGSKQSW